MRIVGIDPGLSITGYGVIETNGSPERVTLVEAGIVRTNASDTLANRLCEIGREMSGILQQFKPDSLAVEDLYSHYGHPKTAIIMGHARGVIFLKAAEAGITVFSYASTRIKNSLTGYGRATKAQMQAMICSTFGLRELPEPADAADALAIALCHCRAAAQTEGVIA